MRAEKTKRTKATKPEPNEVQMAAEMGIYSSAAEVVEKRVKGCTVKRLACHDEGRFFAAKRSRCRVKQREWQACLRARGRQAYW